MHTSRKADILLVIATLLAAAGWIFSKQTIQGMPPFAFIGLRFVLSALILLPICTRYFTKVDSRQFFAATSIGIFQGISLLLWIYSVSISDALGEGAFIMSLSMLFVPLIAWLLYKQKPFFSFWIALPIAFAGLYLLSLSGGWHLSGSQPFFLLAALMLALQFNLNSHYSKSIPTAFLTCIQFFFTGLLALLFSWFTESWPEQISMTTGLWFTASVLPATCMRFFIQIAGQKNTSAANAALIMILEPLWTTILSIVIYAELMSVNKVAGCLLILTALLVYRAWGRIQLSVQKFARK